MTQMDLFQTATSSQQDTPASPFHLPGSAEAVKMTDISGRTFFPLLKPKDPLGAFTKMFMGMSLWASAKCYLTWKGKATPQGHSLFQLVPLTHLTDETEFGSSPEMWATPTASSGEPPKKTEGWTWTGLYWINDKGEKKQTRLKDQVAMWPTPVASDSKGAVKNRFKGSPTSHGNLSEEVRTHQEDGQLNPEWVEWLMGYPEGWTDLEDEEMQ